MHVKLKPVGQAAMRQYYIVAKRILFFFAMNVSYELS